jgi:uncharacterized protein YjbJ (UPF0337 family)
VTSVAGKRDVLLGKLQARYGMVKDDADKQIDEWIAKLPLTPAPKHAKVPS